MASSAQLTRMPASPPVERRAASTRPAQLGRVAPSELRTPRAVVAKHALDVVLSLAALVVLAPLLAAVAFAVKLSSPGPVLYRQRRVGKDGRRFDMLKFRSMRPAAGDEGFVPLPGSAPGGVEGVDRRTRVGRFLRMTSIDELPQLVNVVRGDMSLVGPRPERPEFVELFADEVPGYADRHRMRVGLTGLAQSRGLRGQTSIARRAAADNEYIESWSLWLDAKIFLDTIRLVVLRTSQERVDGHAPVALPVAEAALSSSSRP